MSWMERLSRTYELCASEVGKSPAGSDDQRPRTPLLPICHTTQIAHIELTVDDGGSWVPHMARTLGKAEGTTIVPCTEASASRTSGLEPHPLFDKLPYVAGDYVTFGGEPKRFGYPLYIERLRQWCASPAAHPAVQAVLAYLEKGCLIADLAREGVLVCGADGSLLDQWSGEGETPPIFRLLKEQAQAFVRFSVLEEDGRLLRLCESQAVRQSFIRYQESLDGQEDLCYVHGRRMPRAGTAPAKLRNSGDKAKLISSNDSNSNELTYKGRAAEPWQAVSVSFDAMQKSHNALKWLIERQGWKNGEQAVLAWGLSDKDLPKFMELDGLDLQIQGLARRSTLAPALGGVETFQHYAKSVRDALDGWGRGLEEERAVSVLALDSTNGMIGRLSIPYYRELGGGEFIKRLNFWYATCVWTIEKFKDGEDGKRRWISFHGAPSPKDIIQAAYGSGAGDKLKKAAGERLLPCIIDGAALSPGLVHAAARRAGSPYSEDKESDWRQNLSVTCALLRKLRNDAASRGAGDRWDMAEYKEEYTVALDVNSTERAYLFGRLLAYAEQAESLALFKSGENRQTNAVRLMHQFSVRPASTWRHLEEQLVYYYGKLEDRGGWFKNQIDGVVARFQREDYTDKPLDHVYLLGYHSQLSALRTRKDTKTGEAAGDQA